MTSDLPDSFIAEGLKIAEGAQLFGKPMMQLTREEAIAAAAQGWNADKKSREEMSQRTSFLFDLMGAK